MTTPNRLACARTEDTQILPGATLAIYWTTEQYDTGSTHGAGGKTVLINGQYSAVVNLAVTGLADGETLDVFASEEDAAGVLLASGTPSQITGTGVGPVRKSVALMGHTAQRLVVRARNNGAGIVTLTEARLAMQSWPNA